MVMIHMALIWVRQQEAENNFKPPSDIVNEAIFGIESTGSNYHSPS